METTGGGTLLAVILMVDGAEAAPRKLLATTDIVTGMPMGRAMPGMETELPVCERIRASTPLLSKHDQAYDAPLPTVPSTVRLAVSQAPMPLGPIRRIVGACLTSGASTVSCVSAPAPDRVSREDTAPMMKGTRSPGTSVAPDDSVMVSADGEVQTHLGASPKADRTVSKKYERQLGAPCPLVSWSNVTVTVMPAASNTDESTVGASRYVSSTAALTDASDADATVAQTACSVEAAAGA
mmetsp:Transcript_32387/g.82609  ORF Transcript_32387/g.82609 Transcript_32387/m.82609 type:complete len:239 (-) Transcript_32387:1781-2497(-)